MSAKAFLDTNVVAYALADDADKKALAEKLLLSRPTVSVQVINELVSVCRRKLGLSAAESVIAARMMMRLCDVAPMDAADIERAFEIGEAFRLSHWDALILAVAERNACTLVYSEDLQHGLRIGESLQVLNPFLSG